MTNAVRIAPMAYQITRTQQIRVPEQTPTLVRDARETASTMGGKLGLFHAAVMNVPELQKSKDNYLLAVDPKTMPKESGWYQVNRDIIRDTVTFTPINETEAAELRSYGRMYDILYVRSSAVSAANEGRPVALYVDYHDRSRRFLDAYDWSQNEARVAVSGKQIGTSQTQTGREATGPKAQLAALLRDIHSGTAEVQDKVAQAEELLRGM